MRGLTAKQQRFCEEYVKGRDAADAALRAGYAKGQAKQAGRENLRKAAIQAQIKKLEAERGQTVIAEEDEPLKYLTAVLRGEAEGIKASDQMKAAELLGKRYGLFAEKKTKERSESVEDYLEKLGEGRRF